MSTPAARSPIRKASAALTLAERLCGGGCVLAFVSVFLPWKSNSGSSGVTSSGVGYSYSGVTLSGLHSWGSLTLLIATASLVYFLIRSPLLRSSVQIRTWAVTDATLFMIAGGAEIVTALLYSHHFAGGTLKIGFFLELLGGALTALGGPASRRVAGDTPPRDGADDGGEVRQPPSVGGPGGLE